MGNLNRRVSEKTANYRPDIDGLRAIAILGVLIFHINPSWLGGGFVGVDVFFVISGYLITSIIHRDVAAGSFSILRFYERRIRRIIPALFALFLVVLLVSLRVFLPNDLLNLAKSMKYAVLSISNFFFAGKAEDYFSPGVTGMPLLHTWSLAVEEQFYIFFPLLVLLAHRYLKTKKTLLWIIVTVGLLSLVLSQWMVLKNQTQAFYFLPWRAWEMLLGSFFALAEFPVMKKRIMMLAGGCGLALIAGSMLFFSKGILFPGFSALIPCIGAALVIHSGGHRESFPTKLLSWKPLAFVGLISYSVYLWHWPLVVFAKYLFGDSPVMSVGIFFASLVVGFFSWLVVERPFRNPSFLSRKAVFVVWVVASLLFVAGTQVIKKDKGLRYYPVEVRGYFKDKELPLRYRPHATSYHDPVFGRLIGDHSKPATMALWGDSHALALVPVLDELGAEQGIGIRDYSMFGQPPMLEVTAVRFPDAVERVAYSYKILEMLKNNPEIKTVVIHARWNALFLGGNEVGEGLSPIFGKSFKTAEEREVYLTEKFRETILPLLAAGKHVVLVYPVPEVGKVVPETVIKRVLTGEEVSDTWPLPDFGERRRQTEKLLAPYKGMDGVTIIDPASKLMDNGQVRIRAGGHLLYRDDDHLSMAGSMFLKDLLKPIFQAGLSK